MLISILQNTPHWVWWLLATAISLGVSQTQPWHRTLRAATAIPIVIAALSFYGVVSLFAAQSIALVAWAAVLVALRMSHAAGVGSKVRWLAAEQRLLVPESWVPLMLILGLFIIKFGANVVLAMHPDMSGDRLFAISVSLAYGAFSGIFLARGFAMWRIARQAQSSSMAYRATQACRMLLCRLFAQRTNRQSRHRRERRRTAVPPWASASDHPLEPATRRIRAMGRSAA